MEGKRWRLPGKQSMAGIQWIKSNTMTCSVACACTLPPSFSFLTIYCLSTAISLILWLSASELPHICLLSQEEPEVPESPVHTPCKCCCERKISGWRDRRREGEGETGGKEGTCGRERFTWTLDAVKPEAEKPFCVFFFLLHSHSDFQEPFYQPSRWGKYRKLLWTLPAERQGTDVNRHKAGWKVSTMCYCDSCVMNLVNLRLCESCSGPFTCL